MATIAKLAVQLTANAEGLTSGLGKAGQKLASFANVLSAPSRAIDGFLAPIRGLLGSIPLVGGVFAALPTSIGAATSAIVSNIKEMADLGMTARKLGLDYEQMVTLQSLAGSSSELMERALFKLSAMLGQARAGNEEAIQSIQKMGFAAEDFVGLSLWDAYGKIADKAAAMTDANQRAALAQQFAGRAGVELTAKLAQGRAGLVRAAQAAKEAGMWISNIEGAGVMRAALALKQIDRITKGIGRSLAIEFAPIIGSIAEAFNRWYKQMGGMRGIFAALAKFAADFLVVVASALDEIMAQVKDLAETMKSLKEAKDSLKGPGSQLPGLIRAKMDGGPAPQIQQSDGFLRRIASSLKNVSKWWEQSAKQAKNYGDSLPNQHLLEMAKKSGELTQNLQAEVSAFGRSSHMVALNKLAREGATREMLAGATAIVGELELLGQLTDGAARAATIFDDWRVKAFQLQAALAAGAIKQEGFAGGMLKINDALQKSEMAKALEIFQQTRTPLETMQGKIAELNEMLERGAFEGAAGWEMYERAVYGAASAVMSLHRAQTQLAGAAQFGSQEAYASIAKAEMGGQQGGALESLRDAIKQQMEIQKAQKKDLDDIAQAARQGGLLVRRFN